MQTPVSRRLPLTLFILSLALIFSGSFLASWMQTAGGQIKVSNVRFAGTDGLMMSGKLYLPGNATDETPGAGCFSYSWLYQLERNPVSLRH